MPNLSDNTFPALTPVAGFANDNDDRYAAARAYGRHCAAETSALIDSGFADKMRNVSAVESLSGRLPALDPSAKPISIGENLNRIARGIMGHDS